MKVLIACGILLSVILNLSSLYLHATTDFLTPSFSTTIATLFWLGSVLLFGFAIYLLNYKNIKSKGTQYSKRELFGIVLIFILAAIVRIYKISHLGINLDEWGWLTQAKETIGGSWISPFGYVADKPSTMPGYMVALLFTFIRNYYVAVRLPGVLYSLGTLLFVFLFLREAFSKKVAWAGLILLATSIWDIHTCQVGYQNVSINPFLISGFWYFGYTGIKRGSLFLTYFCGLFCGISINLLYIALLGIFPIFMYWGFMLVGNRSKRLLWIGCILFVSIFLTASPTIPKILRYPQISIGRHQEFISQSIHSAYSGSHSGIQLYIDRSVDAINEFSYKPEKYGFAGLWGVTLDPLTQVLLIFGLLYVLRFIYRGEMLLILLQFVVMFIPIVLIDKSTSVWREYGFIPSVYVISALGFGCIYRFLSSCMKRIVKSRTLLLFVKLAIVGGICIFSWVTSWSLYNRNYLAKEPNALETDCKRTVNFIETSVSNDTVVVLPKELCNLLISIFISNTYKTMEYDSFEDIDRYKNQYRKIAVVKIKENGYSSDFQKQYSFNDFSAVLKNYYPSLQIQPVEEDGTINAILYRL
jgi:Dolichyl-phosphate-mannose-protein mannosyltransferase